jgi:hypothetical protein
VTKTLTFKAWALVASMGLCAALVSGCNPEEPAKPTTPAPTPAVKTPMKGAETKGAAPQPIPVPAPSKGTEK